MSPPPPPDPIIQPQGHEDVAGAEMRAAADRSEVWDVASCVGCGYDLTANETGICSECGHVLEPGRFYPQSYQRQARMHVGCLLAAVAAAHVLAALVFTRPGGFAAILGFSVTYGLGVGVVVFLIAAVSIAADRPHHRLRMRYLFYCTAGWYFWPIAALPLAVVVGALVGNVAASMASLFALCAFGVFWYIPRWRRLCARMTLPHRSIGPLLQLIAFLVGSVVLPTGLLTFAVMRMGPG